MMPTTVDPALLFGLPAGFDNPRILIVQMVVMLSVMSVLLAVLVDFLLFDRKPGVRQGQDVLVRTSTMLGFFLAFYLVIRFRVGQMAILAPGWNLAADIAGVLLLAGGAACNILGRLQLKGNWGDNIRIYDDHTLITGGPYRLVRHPLYASLIWMFTGAALVYRNPLALVLNLAVFVPFMAWRARQEERLLLQTFPEYAAYRRRTGMFLPKPAGLAGFARTRRPGAGKGARHG